MRRSHPATAVLLAIVLVALGAGTAEAQKKKKRPKKPKAETTQPVPAETPAPAETPDGAAGADAGAGEPAGVQPPPAAPAPAAAPDKPGAPTGKGRPAADSPAEAAAVTAGDDVDVDGLRKEYEDVREKLFTSRATSAAVGDALYSARLTVHLRYGSARFFGLRRVTIRLDGATVYDDSRGAIGEDDAPRFEGFVAPGKHVVTVRIETVSKDDERVVSTIENSFSVDAPAERHTVVKAKASDAGDMGWSWKKKNRGSYQLHLDVGVTATKVGK